MSAAETPTIGVVEHPGERQQRLLREGLETVRNRVRDAFTGYTVPLHIATSLAEEAYKLGAEQMADAVQPEYAAATSSQPVLNLPASDRALATNAVVRLLVETRRERVTGRGYGAPIQLPREEAEAAAAVIEAALGLDLRRLIDGDLIESFD